MLCRQHSGRGRENNAKISSLAMSVTLLFCWCHGAESARCRPTAFYIRLFQKDQFGHRSGREVELLQYICAENNWQLTWVMIQPLGDDPRLAMLEAGLIDLAAYMITITPEREKRVIFTEPYFTSGTGIIVAANSEYRRLTDLEGAEFKPIKHLRVMTLCSTIH